MHRHDLALIGFGGVNRALAEIIHTRADELADDLGFALRVVAITDLRLGSLMQADGIDLGAVLALPEGATFAGMPGGAAVPQNDFVIRSTTADIVVTFVKTGEALCLPAPRPVKTYEVKVEAGEIWVDVDGSTNGG